MRQLTTSIEHEGEEAVVRVHGDLDIDGTLRLEPQIGDLIDRRKVRHLTIDLGDVSFLDSTGLGLLLQIDSRARVEDFELTLLPGSPQVQRVFSLAGLDDTLPFDEPR